MSLQSLLSIARSALTVHQRAMDVTGHNVANVNTPGYTRQTLVLSAMTPGQTPLYPVGRGVEALAIQRTRNTFYDASYRQENGLLGQATTRHDYLSQIEGSMNEPSDTGIASSLDGMFRSLADLGNDPASRMNRELVVSAAGRLVGQLHSLTAKLGSIRQEAFDNLNTQVNEVNSIAAQIANLNVKIQATGGPSHTSPDLMDARDALINQLSDKIDVRVIDNGNGSVSVSAGDTMLVDSANVQKLAVTTIGSGWGVAPAAGGSAITPQAGSIKALADLTQTGIPGIESQLDAFAGSLVTQFNTLHRTGTTLTGATNVDFFDPANTTAATISLSAALLASPDNIAASATGALGNGGIAQQLAGLATAPIAALGGKTLREHYVTLATNVGLDVQSAAQDIDVQQSLADSSAQSSDAVSGVNMDEEMISLIGEQQAYQAAARLVTIADQLMQQILQIV